MNLPSRIVWAIREPGAVLPYLRRKLRGREAAPESRTGGIADEAFYRPLFSPWSDPGYGNFGDTYGFAKEYTLVPPECCYVLLTLAEQAARLSGSWIECGVYRGGTAMMLARLLHNSESDSVLHLFDTFEGMPDTDPDRDLHGKGDFGDTTLRGVRKRVLGIPGVREERVLFHPGFMPGTFEGLALEEIAFAHVDVDIYRSVLDASTFVYPRLMPGGVIVFDDYGRPTCPGARKAVDEYFADKPETVLVLPTRQAIVTRLPASPASP